MSRACLPAVFAAFVTLFASCQSQDSSPEEAPLKLRDLAPPFDPTQVPKVPGAIALQVHLYDVPKDHLHSLQSIWQVARTRGIRYKNHNAFRANAFRIGRTRAGQWNWISGTLTEARAKKVHTASLLVTDDYDTDLAVRRIPNPTPLTFVDQNNVGVDAKMTPGVLALRMRAQPHPKNDGYSLLAYPALTLSISHRIPQLIETLRRREKAYMSAAFSAQLLPDDVLILGPEEYVGTESTLGGLFFGQSDAMYYMDPHQPQQPEAKAVVRLYVIRCTAIRMPSHGP